MMMEELEMLNMDLGLDELELDGPDNVSIDMEARATESNLDVEASPDLDLQRDESS